MSANTALFNPNPYVNQLRQIAQTATDTPGLGLGGALGCVWFTKVFGAGGYMFAAHVYSEGKGPGTGAVGGSVPMMIGRRGKMVPRVPVGQIGSAAIAGIGKVNITAPGAGYVDGDTVTFGASAALDQAKGDLILSSGTVVGVVIRNPGGYTIGGGNPSATIASGGGGLGATATTTLATGGWNQPQPGTSPV